MLELGPIPGGALLFAMACTIWLVLSRVRRCFRVRGSSTVRDVGLLFSGPVMAILISFVKVAVYARAYLQGGLDVEMGLIASLHDAVRICVIGMSCFAIGICSLMLPTKSDTNVR